MTAPANVGEVTNRLIKAKIASQMIENGTLFDLEKGNPWHVWFWVETGPSPEQPKVVCQWPCDMPRSEFVAERGKEFGAKRVSLSDKQIDLLVELARAWEEAQRLQRQD